MTLPDYLYIAQGTAIIWGDAAGTGETHTITLSALADGAARQGAAADLGANYADEYLIFMSIETGTAPTAGNTVDLYLVCSYDNTLWPAKVGTSDAAYTLGTSDANLKQAGAPVVSLIATNDLNTQLTQAPVIWRPTGRYVVPIVDNNLGQALRTANNSKVYAIPRTFSIVE